MFGTLASLVACELAGCGGRAPRPSRAPLRLDLALSIPGVATNGELGFRFSPPLDVDGDGIAEVAAGARFTDLAATQMGTAGIWSTKNGARLAWWEGAVADALFGHAVVLGPDIDRDGAPDVVVAAPNGKYDTTPRGLLTARSSRTGAELWSVLGEPLEGFGWDLALAGDQDGDGVGDIFAGAPERGSAGKVYLVGGRDGAVLRSYPSPSAASQFGWYVASAPDLDGDGVRDLVVGAPDTEDAGTARAGAVYVVSAASGRLLREWYGTRADGLLGEIVAALADIDGDGVADIVAGAPFQARRPPDAWHPGEVFVYSGASGATLFRWEGRQPGEMYGRLVTAAGDLDGDGTGDIAIGAPWSGTGELARAGRFEVRSGRSGEVIFEVEGDRADLWLGWHMEAGSDLGPERERGLVAAALRSDEGGVRAAGALRVYVVRGTR